MLYMPLLSPTLVGHINASIGPSDSRNAVVPAANYVRGGSGGVPLGGHGAILNFWRGHFMSNVHESQVEVPSGDA